MEALKLTGIAHKGVLSVSVPPEFEERELEVIILSTAEKFEETDKVKESVKQEEKIKRLMSIAGAAKFPDSPLTKYDVYEQ